MLFHFFKSSKSLLNTYDIHLSLSGKKGILDCKVNYTSKKIPILQIIRKKNFGRNLSIRLILFNKKYLSWVALLVACPRCGVV